MTDIEEYFSKMKIVIANTLKAEQSVKITYDILDDSYDKNFKLQVLKDKQRRMKIGKIWQEMIGNFPGYINIDNKIDIISHDYKFLIELKNRTNTDNMSSKMFNYEKLYQESLIYKDYTCIYACINCSSEHLTMSCKPKIINYKTINIHHYSGMSFLTLIFKQHTDKVINFLKQEIKNY